MKNNTILYILFFFLGMLSTIALLLPFAPNNGRYHAEDGQLCKIEVNVRVNKADDKLDIINYHVVECI